MGHRVVPGCPGMSWDVGIILHGASVLEDCGTSSGLLGMSIPLVPGL